MEENLLSVREASKILGVTKACVMRLVNKGVLRPHIKRLDGSLLFKQSTIEDYKGNVNHLDENVEYLSTAEVAELLSVSFATVYSYEDRGLLTSVRKVERGWRYYPKEQVDKLLGGKECVNTEGLVTVKQLAQRANVSKTFVYNLAKIEYIKPVVVLLSGQQFYNPTDVDIVINARNKGIDTLMEEQ